MEKDHSDQSIVIKNQDPPFIWLKNVDFPGGQQVLSLYNSAAGPPNVRTSSTSNSPNLRKRKKKDERTDKEYSPKNKSKKMKLEKTEATMTRRKTNLLKNTTPSKFIKIIFFYSSFI